MSDIKVDDYVILDMNADLSTINAEKVYTQKGVEETFRVCIPNYVRGMKLSDSYLRIEDTYANWSVVRFKKVNNIDYNKFNEHCKKLKKLGNEK